MDFKDMCIRAGMSRERAEEYADLVGYANWLDKLLIFYYVRGLMDGKEAAYELERLEKQNKAKTRKEREKRNGKC